MVGTSPTTPAWWAFLWRKRVNVAPLINAVEDTGLKTFKWFSKRNISAIFVLTLLACFVLALRQWLERPIAIETFTIITGSDTSGVSGAAIVDQIKFHVSTINNDSGDLFEVRKLGEATFPLDVKIGESGLSFQNLLKLSHLRQTSAQVSGSVFQVGASLTVQATTLRGNVVTVDSFPIALPSKQPPQFKEDENFVTSIDQQLACLALRIVQRVSPHVAANYVFKHTAIDTTKAVDVDYEVSQRGACITGDAVDLYSNVVADPAALPAEQTNALVGLAVHYSSKREYYEELQMALAATKLITQAYECTTPNSRGFWRRLACRARWYNHHARNVRAEVAAWMQLGAAYSDYAGSESDFSFTSNQPLQSVQRDIVENRRSAIDAYEKVIQINPRYAQAYDAIGFQLESLGEKSNAERAYNNSLAAGETAAAHVDLGWLYLNGRHDSYEPLTASPASLRLAASEFARAAQMKPDYWDAHSSLGYVLSSSLRARDAVDVLEPAVEHNDYNTDLLRLLGSAYASACRFSDARAKFQAAYKKQKSKDDDVSTLENWGLVLDSAGLRQSAIDQEKAVLAANADDLTARRSLGKMEAGATDSGTVQRGLTDLYAAAYPEAKKSNYSIETYLAALVQNGLAQQALSVYRQWSQAGVVPAPLPIVDNATSATPLSNQHVRLAYASALIQTGQWELALPELQFLADMDMHAAKPEIDELRAAAVDSHAAPELIAQIEHLATDAVAVQLPERCMLQKLTALTSLAEVAIH